MRFDLVRQSSHLSATDCVRLLLLYANGWLRWLGVGPSCRRGIWWYYESHSLLLWSIWSSRSLFGYYLYVLGANWEADCRSGLVLDSDREACWLKFGKKVGNEPWSIIVYSSRHLSLFATMKCADVYVLQLRTSYNSLSQWTGVIDLIKHTKRFLMYTDF